MRRYFLVSIACLTAFCSLAQDWEKDLAQSLKMKQMPGGLLVIGDDRSGSTKNNRQLTKEQYQDIITAFLDKTGGTVASRVIGNPNGSELEFYRYSRKSSPINYPDLDAFSKKWHLTLNDRTKAKNLIAKAKAEEVKNINSDNESLKQYLQKIQTAIINYKAARDVTNINDFFTHVNSIVSEPKFSNKTIYLVLLSDGIHDADKKAVSNLNFRSKVKIHLVGWKNKSVFTGNVTTNYYESVEGLMESIDYLY